MVNKHNLGIGSGGAEAGSLGMTLNGIALSAGTMVRLGIGFLTWFVAARLYSSSQVGLAAAAISAMFLCTQVGTLGVDLALVALFPQHRQKPQVLLDTAITLGLLTSALAGLMFVALSAAGLHSLRVIAASPVYSSLFLVLTFLGGAWWIMDQAAVALRRSDQVLVRAMLATPTTLAGVGLLGVLGWRSAAAILASWVAAAVVACTIGLVQLARTISHYRFSPRLADQLWGRLVVVALPNFAMTAADNAPGLLLPIVTAEVVSTRAAAFWYVVWMMALAAYTIPAAFGLNLFAAAVGAPAEVAQQVRHALRTAGALAAGATVALAGAGPFVLSLLGSSYASHGTTPLRIMALAAVPMVVIKVYLAVCRAHGRMLEGTVVAAVLGAAAVGIGAAAAAGSGLSGIAAAWLSVMLAGALGTGVRLRVLLQGRRAAVDSGARWTQAERVTAP